jgi:SUN domain-containing protein 1/2
LEVELQDRFDRSTKQIASNVDDLVKSMDKPRDDELNTDKQRIMDIVQAATDKLDARKSKDLDQLKLEMIEVVNNSKLKQEQGLSQSKQEILQQISIQIEAALAPVIAITSNSKPAPVFDDSHLKEYFHKYVSDAIEKYNADKVGMIDYAVKAAGGRVVVSSPTFHLHHALAQRSGGNIMNWIRNFNTPPHVTVVDNVLEEVVHLGECWPMQGSNGFVIIKVVQPLFLSHVSIEHVSRHIAHDPTSMPKAFEVRGLPNESNLSHAEKLSTFVYSDESTAVQTFPVTSGYNKGSGYSSSAYSLFKVDVLSNYGNSDYTCIYRIRIHGKPASQQRI